MSIFFTSDHHFGHERILELGAGRPFQNIGHHNTILMNNWLEVVKPEDTVYVMGDIAMGNFEQTIKLFASLTGEKFLIPGNHDKIFSGTNNAKRIERFTPFYEEVGFTILPENTSIMLQTSYGEQKVLLSHFPYTGDSHSPIDRYRENRYLDEGLPIIHGHTHSRDILHVNPREYHIGVDAHDYYPVHENKIIQWLEQLKKERHI